MTTPTSAAWWYLKNKTPSASMSCWQGEQYRMMSYVEHHLYD